MAEADAREEEGGVPDDPIERRRVLESLLFAADEPVTGDVLRRAFGKGADVKALKSDLRTLADEIRAENRAWTVEEVAGGFTVLTRPEYAPWLRRLKADRTSRGRRLTQAALETLAVVAYRQPVLRAEVESIRGVSCGETLRTLIEAGLVRITGRAESLGRPLLYGTTRRFLEHFGLANLRELPKAERLRRPDEPEAAADDGDDEEEDTHEADAGATDDAGVGSTGSESRTHD